MSSCNLLCDCPKCGGHPAYKRIAELEARNSELERWQAVVNAGNWSETTTIHKLNRQIKEQAERVCSLEVELKERAITWSSEMNKIWKENTRLRETFETIKLATFSKCCKSCDAISALANRALTRQAAAQIVADPGVPPTEIHLRQDGKTVGKIVNIEPPVQGCNICAGKYTEVVCPHGWLRGVFLKPTAQGDDE